MYIYIIKSRYVKATAVANFIVGYTVTTVIGVVLVSLKINVKVCLMVTQLRNFSGN